MPSRTFCACYLPLSRWSVLCPKPGMLFDIPAYHMCCLNILIYTRLNSNKFIFKTKVYCVTPINEDLESLAIKRK